MLVEYLERGVLAGALAGLVYGIYVAIVANPLVAYMNTLAHYGDGHGHGHEHALEHATAVSETTTAIVSVGSGILWGIFLGGLFAIAFYVFEPALPGTGRVSAFVLAGAGFLTVSGTPWLVLPPATPGAEQAFGTNPRLAIYVGLMVLGAIVAAASIVAYNRTTERTANRYYAVALAAVPVVATIAIVPVVTPTIVTAGEMPPNLVAAVQGLTALSQAGLWAIVASGFSWLDSRPESTDGTIPLDDDLSMTP